MGDFWKHIIKPKGPWARWLIFITLLGIVIAGVTGNLAIVSQYLDTEALTFRAGDFQVSAWGVLRALLLLVLIFWITAAVADAVQYRVRKLGKLHPTTRTLVSKILQIAIYVIAFLIALDVLGLNLTTLTVFSGAVGIGVGFGLQTIASNFISGLILLLERSVDIDDLIELPDGVTGFVRKSSARYTLLETLDGKEVLVPNEDFITNRVTNWTLSTSKARVEIKIGVAYGCDLELAHDLILQAATEHAMCMSEPAPQCFLRNFGDNSIDFTLTFWVEDIVAGRWRPQSDVMFAIWHKFRDNGIEIPFPQRDLHIKNPAALKEAINAQ
ncbi:mechanosensitive ion channel family protein [Maricaulis sp.]|uniref:mechanosensitive ion channel family protein n=1 Tax=Maricaulis sp. TaxID=1486257 RepID=UPI003A94C058